MLDALACPKCQAQNRPGVHYVKFNENGLAECFVCGFSFAAVEQA